MPTPFQVHQLKIRIRRAESRIHADYRYCIHSVSLAFQPQSQLTMHQSVQLAFHKVLVILTIELHKVINAILDSFKKALIQLDLA